MAFDTAIVPGSDNKELTPSAEALGYFQTSVSRTY
jgi:hypothetical protein